jgi:lipopolysaccharide transport system permease protein
MSQPVQALNWNPAIHLVNIVRSFLATALRNRGLVAEMVSRDLKTSHVGHGFGSIWIFIQPLVVVLTFMLIFGVVIGAKMAVSRTFPGDYTSYILAGLVPWLIMQNALARGPSLFASHANLVKQVVFPVEILPVASTIACFIIFIPCLVLLLAYMLVFGAGLSPFVILLPGVLIAHMIFSLGLILILSVTTPFMRDIREFVGLYLVVAMYFTPAVYLPDWVPAAIRPMLYLNPFSYVVWVYQDVLFFGRIDHGFAWIVFGLMTLVTFAGGLILFRKIKPFLGNVL